MTCKHIYIEGQEEREVETEERERGPGEAIMSLDLSMYAGIVKPSLDMYAGIVKPNIEMEHIFGKFIHEDLYTPWDSRNWKTERMFEDSG